MTKPKKKSNLLVTIISLTLTCFFCMVFGLVTDTSRDKTPPAAAEPAATPQASPTPTQPPATDQPPAIPGIAPVDVTLNLEQSGLTCSNVQTSKDKQASSKYFWTCERSEGEFTIFSSVAASKLNTVDFIEAAVIQLDNPSTSTAVEFLGFVATIPFIDDTASQQQAKDWVGKTIPTLTGEGDVRETTINGIRLVVYGLPTAFTLEIGELR